MQELFGIGGGELSFVGTGYGSAEGRENYDV